MRTHVIALEITIEVLELHTEFVTNGGGRRNQARTLHYHLIGE